MPNSARGIFTPLSIPRQLPAAPPQIALAVADVRHTAALAAEARDAVVECEKTLWAAQEGRGDTAMTPSKAQDRLAAARRRLDVATANAVGAERGLQVDILAHRQQWLTALYQAEQSAWDALEQRAADAQEAAQLHATTASLVSWLAWPGTPDIAQLGGVRAGPVIDLTESRLARPEVVEAAAQQAEQEQAEFAEALTKERAAIHRDEVFG